jgi:hypothetical protein
MRSVIDRNVVMRRMTVLRFTELPNAEWHFSWKDVLMAAQIEIKTSPFWGGGSEREYESFRGKICDFLAEI